MRRRDCAVDSAANVMPSSWPRRHAPVAGTTSRPVGTQVAGRQRRRRLASECPGGCHDAAIVRRRR
jgi:hypothetical protein